MIDEFHCDKGGEPRRSRLREEFVMVGCYVVRTDVVGKVSLEDRGEQGDGVDDWIGALVYFNVPILFSWGWREAVWRSLSKEGEIYGI